MLIKITILFADVIFFIFLYQKYIYPVDQSRINEYGTSGEIEEKIKQGIYSAEGVAEAIANGHALEDGPRETTNETAQETTQEDKKNQ